MTSPNRKTGAAPAIRANRAADAALLTECGDDYAHPEATLPEQGSDIFVLPGRVRGTSLTTTRRQVSLQVVPDWRTVGGTWVPTGQQSSAIRGDETGD